MDNEGKLISDFHPPISCDYRDLLIHNSVGCLTVMYIKDRFNFFFPDCGHEDYALWLNILKHTNAVYGIQEPLAKYRLSTNGVSSNKIKNLSFFYYIYNKLEGFSYFRSFLYCIRYAWFAKNKYR
jgi:teichuronic acid biosynthesis glycosyltransferase TuaG